MSLLRREPAAVAGAVQAVLTLIVAFGINVSGELQGAILTATTALLALFVRHNVTPVAEKADDEKPKTNVELAEQTWVMLGGGGTLHHMAAHDAWGDTDDRGGGTTSCGRTGELVLPLPSETLFTPRCRQCCGAVGYPEGKGSPMNDAAIRPLIEARLGSNG